MSGWPHWWKGRRSRRRSRSTKMLLVMEEKKKRRQKGAPEKEERRKRGCLVPYQLLLPSGKCHVSSARERADDTNDEKPQCCRTKNLMQPTPASDFGWRKKRLLSCLIKGEKCLESLSPSPRPGHLESQGNPMPLERVWSLCPHLRLDHITL